MKIHKSKDDPITQAEWKLWIQDNFDLECPRQISRSGRGLIEGLIELWAHHLYETIQPTGFLGFNHFNLWWEQLECSIEVIGDVAGQLKLRQWIFEGRRSGFAGCMEIADKDLLRLIAQTHSSLVLNNQKGEAIVNLAIESENKESFRTQMKNFGLEE